MHAPCTDHPHLWNTSQGSCEVDLRASLLKRANACLLFLSTWCVCALPCQCVYSFSVYDSLFVQGKYLVHLKRSRLRSSLKFVWLLYNVEHNRHSCVIDSSFVWLCDAIFLSRSEPYFWKSKRCARLNGCFHEVNMGEWGKGCTAHGF